ncbi:MAG: SRPBCC family protein [Bacteroidetes bacterium]|nr:SRPBCC family protein [Bacteroidota bacterium]
MKPIILAKSINAPINLVFNSIAHIEEFAKIVNDIVDVEFLSENKTGLGARFRETRMMKGKEATTELEVTEYKIDEKIRLVAEAGGTIWDTLFTVKEENGKTILAVTMNASAKNLFAKLINMLIAGMVTKSIDKDMNAVKVYCEK